MMLVYEYDEMPECEDVGIAAWCNAKLQECWGARMPECWDVKTPMCRTTKNARSLICSIGLAKKNAGKADHPNPNMLKLLSCT